MNKLNLIGGGHPLVIEDFLFLQSAYRDGFKAAMQMFSATYSFIMSGCELTPPNSSTVNISEGFVYHNGEIWFVGSGVNLPKATLVLNPDIAYQAPNPIPYASGANVNVKEVRKMLPATSLEAGGIVFSELKSFWQLLHAKSNSWVNIGTLEIPLEPNITIDTLIPPKFRRNVIGEICFAGNLYVDTNINSPSIPLFSLPSEYLGGGGSFYIADNSVVCRILIISNGTVHLTTTNGNTFSELNLLDNNFRIRLDCVKYLQE
ncbi:MAG: hypothetical protein IPI59_15700 [Sphingobacteriales bacterium]|jgi:hypothetical protein|nr:hypothetical protein [Sphingobacteriales bacterium]MDA0200032.1 hypothetical protein [Bacteroidota bacterium]MBK6888551.1 hypothetical protein [Sphingobacteriales bacterium]MBK7528940.1 hypothetical protein [Sphingobacteriales bacterium]MBK8679067.1 hypothetical protein [Sphingobacteriales bacterium]